MVLAEPERRVEPGVLLRMRDALAHRGPDDAGVYCAAGVGLAHRRLSIIDLSPAGRQPMANEDGTARIVFNGEIYNFQELRPALEAAGHRFRSRTDTEVVLHLYEEHGPDCLAFLRGMFAFAIWDERRRRLFLARDRLGKKPLVYQEDARAFRFASEAKAILQDPAVEARPDPEAVARYLTYGYVPGARSAFAGFRRLPPAHSLVWEDGRATVRRYWSPRRDVKHDLTEAEWCAQIRERLREAVRVRLVSDVPLGAFLSGGIDSSAVVAMMAAAAPGRLRTFSIGFDDPDYDELRFARLVAERFGSEHHEDVVRMCPGAILDTLAWHYDEPFGDSSAVPTYYVAQAARRHVSVALTGDAGDESFGGYERYAATGMAERAGSPGRALARLGRAVWPAGGRRSGVLARGRRLLEGMSETGARRYARWVCRFHGEAKAALCTPAFREAAADGEELEDLQAALKESGAADAVDAVMAADLGLYLPQAHPQAGHGGRPARAHRGPAEARLRGADRALDRGRAAGLPARHAALPAGRGPRVLPGGGGPAAGGGAGARPRRVRPPLDAAPARAVAPDLHRRRRRAGPEAGRRRGGRGVRRWRDS
jgi:asparagine synthase (glutamine-hydrolysing)